MSFLDFFKKRTTEKPKEEKPELQKHLDDLGVMYDETDGAVICLDHTGANAFSFTNEGDTYFKDGAPDPWSLDGVIDFVQKFQIKDQALNTFENSEFYDSFNTVYKDLTKLISDAGRTASLEVKDNMVYIVEHNSNDDTPLASIKIDDGKTFSFPSNKERSLSEIFASAANTIYKENRDVFNADYNPALSFENKEIWKAISTTIPMVDRLNALNDVEAKNYENGKTIFIMFKNGSAIEYTLPTKQKEGNILILEYDKENRVNNNISYFAVMDILRIPKTISLSIEGSER